MKVITAKSAGFCFGVRRAIELAEKTVQGKKRVYTYGPLIHNPQEVKRLAKAGIRSIEAHGRLRDATLIVRTHGIPQELREKLEQKKLCIVDATCPFVKRAQDIIKKLSADDVQIIIVGEKTHPEVVGLVSYCRHNGFVVDNRHDITKAKLGHKPVFVVSQTTQTPENFAAVVAEIRKTCRNVTTFNTICKATKDRQEAARQLARRVDVMIVIGGKNSGNTRRLAQICSACTPTHHIETEKELKAGWFTRAKNVGLTAGASTPDWIIDRVANAIGGKTDGRYKGIK
ncbi:MAG: 4-hydroxy-3-methylbut-2-enyl diphosphate reductase [Endomicrobiales bacterium]|jgi:4-hydroxy-3-methylbut-2-enyl diphosphate reductase